MRRLVLGLAAVTLVAGCGSNNQSTDNSSATTELLATDAEASTDPMEALLDDAGELPLEAAMALFAATFAPLPGVTAAEVEGDLHESSYLLRVLWASKDQLTGEQLAVLEEALGPIGAPLDDLLGGAGARAGIARDQLLRDAAVVLRDAQAYYARELGVAICPSRSMWRPSQKSMAAFVAFLRMSAEMRSRERWMGTPCARSG